MLDVPRAREPLELVRKHRLACQGHEHLAG